jgi:sulfate transport system permease protein
MTTDTLTRTAGRRPFRARTLREPQHVRWAAIVITALFLSLFLILPIIAVFTQALEQGLGTYFRALAEPETLAAVRLTLLITIIAVPMNLVFGVLSAWAIAKFDFRGKNVLVTLIDLPIAVSPVIAGMIFVLLYGSRGLLGPWLASRDVKIIFALPGIVMTTLFITLPYITRELVPVMQAQGMEEEEAALTLGANGWRTFWKVTLPNIRWGMLYGLILCTARAIGEFGAVSVVSGHIRGRTNTVPLHVEILYNGYNFTAAFAVASAMIVLALVTLCVKGVVEWKSLHQLQATSGKV